jgi:hypothetical protein
MGENVTEQIMAQVRVFRTLQGRSQRVYRQLWSGQPVGTYDVTALSGERYRLMLLKGQARQGYLVLRLGGGHTQDFSVDQFTHEWPLANFLVAMNVSPQEVNRLGLLAPLHPNLSAVELYQVAERLRQPRSHSPAPSGPARLVAPYFNNQVRTTALAEGDFFHIEMQVLHLQGSWLKSIFNSQYRTSSFHAFPLGDMEFGNFNVQYLSVEQPERPLLIHSVCQNGYTSFGRVHCRDEAQALRYMFERGVLPTAAAAQGLNVPETRLANDIAVQQIISQLGSQAKVIQPKPS